MGRGVGDELSVAAMAWAWKQELDPRDKFVLLALADHAADDDYTCWPSLSHLEKKTGYARPTVWKSIDRLIEAGAVKRVGESKAGSTIYEVMVGNEINLGNPITQVTKLPGVGNAVTQVGKELNEVGNGVTPNHQEPSRTITEPSCVESPRKANGLAGQALEVLTFLNAKTRRHFRGVDKRNRPTPNLKFIMARLESGVSVQDCKTVIARKFRDWAPDDKMRSYLRPETLFNATKFEQYLGECTTEEMPRE
jgi:uncharacterized phage protein (TIGR02220 family)